MDPLEGAHIPRARRSLARGGVQPSSEAEFRPRGRPALEQGGVSPEGAFSPRARRSLVVRLVTVNFRQPSYEFTFRVGIDLLF
jgi:hypothetical protein